MFIDGENFMTMLGFSKYGISTFPKIWEVKQPTIDKYVMQKLRPFFPDCCGPNGVCINPHRDCINCPTRGCGVVGYWSVTTTNVKDNL